jgi:hypothetical protein
MGLMMLGGLKYITDPSPFEVETVVEKIKGYK